MGAIWELTAHSEGLTGFSPKGLHGEERGVPWGVTITEEVLGVGGREGVSGWERSGEGEEDEVRGVGRGRGGGGGGQVRASMSLPCRGKDRGGHKSTGTEGGTGESAGDAGNVERRSLAGGQDKF